MPGTDRAYDRLPVAVLRFDRQFRFLFVNRRYCEQVGQPAEELVGRTFADLKMEIPTESKTAFSAAALRVFDSAHSDECVFQLAQPDGPRTIHTTLIPELAADGTVSGILTVGTDVSELRQALDARRSSEQLFSRFMDHLPVNAWMKDAGGRYVFVNRSTEEAYGRPLTDWLGKTDAELFPPEVADPIRRNDLAVLESGAAARVQETSGGPDGRPRTYLSIKFPVADVDGQPLVGGAAVDITDRLRAEELNRLSDEVRMRAVVDSAADGIVTITADGIVEEVNPAVERLFGYTREEMVGRNVSMLMPEPHRSGHDGYLAAYHRTGQHTVIGRGREVEGRRKDGSTFPLHLSVSVVRLHDRVLFTGILHDLSERVAAEQRMAAALREKETLLKEVHHRVKNNLAITISLLNFQMRGLDRADRSLEVLREAQNRVRSMALVHEMLYQSVSLSDIDLPAYVGQLVRHLTASYSINQRVRVALDLTPTALHLEAAIPFGLIVNELVSNAFKYAFPGERSGTLTVCLRPDATGQVTVAVADDGVGLPPSVDPFNTRSLGLRLVRDLTHQLGGQLDLDRTGGTRFRVTFPAPTGGQP